MEENDGEIPTLKQLLCKRKKLVNLRDTLISTDKYKANTPGPVGTHHSVSNSGIPRSEIENIVSVPQCSSPTDTKTPSSSSPLRPMSPETRQLFDILNEHQSILENSDISHHEDVVCDFDSDDSVRDPNFILSHDRGVNISESTTSCSSLDNNGPIETIIIENEVNSYSNEETGRPKKGRKRKYLQNRADFFFNKYNNFEYTTTKNEIVKQKVFKDYQCKCLKKCADLVPVEVRKQEFERFVKLGSFNAQVLFITSCVTENNKKRSYTMTNIPDARKKPKQFYRVYKIKDVKVCQQMFLKTFQITTQKVTVALRKCRNDEPIMDRRGMHRGVINKLSDEEYKFIVYIINKLPKYESHYRRNNNGGSLYLQPGMTINKIHDLYKKEYTEIHGTERKCASLETLKKIFYAKFNLKCKKLKKDTCNKCDQLSIKISNAKSQEEQEQATSEKSQHLERAETLRNQMNQDFLDAKNNPDVECLTFDLEKTLPLPRIPTNVAFYKRQLWLYNSGIHSASDDVGHCYVWVEGEAGRGAQEVGSCLIKYIETKLQPSVKRLILWSDCCGGQNRNIKIVLLLKTALCSHPTLESITFRFLESGHTFLPNDTDFSKIETELKHHQRIFTAEEYIDIFKNAKNRNR